MSFNENAVIDTVKDASTFIENFREFTTPLISAPPVRQCFDYDCSAACITSLLFMFGRNVRIGRVLKMLGISEENIVDRHHIPRVLSFFGIRSEQRENLSLDFLENAVRCSQPVMTAIQAWGNNEEKETLLSGHFVIVIGSDKKNIYCMDPSILGYYGYIPREEFLNSWIDIDKHGTVVKRYGIVIQRPSGLSVKTKRIKATRIL